MDTLLILAIVDGTLTEFEFTAERIGAIHLEEGGRATASMRAGVYQGKPVNWVAMKQAEVLIAYKGRHEKPQG